MESVGIEASPEAVNEFCRRWHIHRLALFGSVLHGDFGPTSDVDVLVEFEKDHGVGLITFARLENELSEVFGRKVDLNTSGCLSRYFRDKVLGEAKTLYVNS